MLGGIVAPGEAVTLYAEELEMPPTRSETIYYLVLAHRSANAALPAGEEADSPRALQQPMQQSLRVVGSRRAARRRHIG
jgi:hypothetical protein